MFDNLFGNTTVSKLLLFIARFGEGYPSQIARNFDITVSMVQQQLDRLETGGILVSQLKGKTRMYTMSPRYPFKKELLALLHKGLDSIPKKEIDVYYSKRMRPRRRKKPL